MSGAPLSRAALADDLARHAFALGVPAASPCRTGAEAELIPVEAATGRRVPIAATLPLLRRFGGERGWREEPSPYGVPRFVVPDGGIVSYEPGGQVELSTPPFASLGALVGSLRGTVVPLRRRLREEGIELLSVGIDPLNTIGDVPQQLPGRRYVAMTEFLERLGTGGTRMMRLTASLQLSLDPGAAPLRRWRLLNALAPFVVALFASSPVSGGRPTGERSFRARVWRELDGGRTGLFRCGADPVGEYLDFALAAPAILLPWGEDGARPFSAHAAAGAASFDDWRDHLSTLFPEVRPRGFAEVRSCDAVAPEWYAAPLVFLAGLAYDPAAAAEAAELLGEPDPELLERAGRLGLRDPFLAAMATVLCGVALRGADALGEAVVPGAVREEAREFFRRYTLRGRSPADDVLAAEASSTDGASPGGASGTPPVDVGGGAPTMESREVPAAV